MKTASRWISSLDRQFATRTTKSGLTDARYMAKLVTKVGLPMPRDCNARVLDIPLNNLRALDHAPSVEFCRRCGRTLDPFDAGIDVFERPKGGQRLSVTLDGFVIKSRRFSLTPKLWDSWNRATKQQWLSVDYYLASPVRIVRTAQADIAKAAGNCCEECGAVALSTVPENIFLHFAEVPIGSQDVVKTDFMIGRDKEGLGWWAVQLRSALNASLRAGCGLPVAFHMTIGQPTPTARTIAMQ